jgi:hypothetical protein
MHRRNVGVLKRDFSAAMEPALLVCEIFSILLQLVECWRFPHFPSDLAVSCFATCIYIILSSIMCGFGMKCDRECCYVEIGNGLPETQPSLPARQTHSAFAVLWLVYVVKLAAVEAGSQWPQ